MKSSVELGIEFEKDFCHAHSIPLLPLSPEERLRALLAFRNDRKLFRRQCDATGDALISCYHPQSPFTVVKSDIWWGDNWDGLESGMAADLTKPLFPQFAQLQRRIPREGTSVVNAENCEYNSHTRESKNCYLSHLAFRCEGVLYSYWSLSSRDLLECSYSSDSELCFRCSYITQGYDLKYVEESANCNGCSFGFQLRDCSNCILCANLTNASNMIRNQPASPEEIKLFRERLATDPQFFHSVLAEFTELKQNSPHRAQHTLHCEDVIGEHLNSCKQCYYCFDSRNSERCFNAANGGGHNIIHGYSVGFPECSSVYSSVTIRNSSDIFFCSGCWNSHNLWYCDNCVDCKDCFFCSGLKHRRYCFLNQQYTEADYWALVGQARDLMNQTKELGLFFPMADSPFAYNESAAQDFFPLTKSEAEALGSYWRDSINTSAAHASHSERTPDERVAGPSSRTGPSSITVNSCSRCRARYRFVERELELYRQFGVQTPDLCPDCRLTERLLSRTPYSLASRSCANCNRPLESTQLDSAVLCDACYHSLF